MDKRIKILERRIKNIVLKTINEQPIDNIKGQGNAKSPVSPTTQSPSEIPPASDAPDTLEPETENDLKEKGESLYSPESMIKLFNAIRSGQSMKNEMVVHKLNEWWDTNSKNELKKFLFMLANVAKIVSEKAEEEEEPEKSEEETLASGAATPAAATTPAPTTKAAATPRTQASVEAV